MIKVDRLFDLDKKFLNYSSWSGADGIYSYKVGEVIYMYFSDTFIGDSSSDGIRQNFTLINNSLATSYKNNISFIFNKNPVSSVFIPSSGYLWLEDSFLEDDKIFIYALNMENDIFSSNPFEIKGVCLIETSACFKEGNKYKIHELKKDEYNVVWGIATLKEDYYYIYGYINEYGNKKLVLKRTKDLLSDEYEYLDEGYSFCYAPSKLGVLKEHFEAESKVIKKGDYYYIAYTKDSVSSDIYLIRTKDIAKPYEEEIFLYRCEEHKGNIITYNAKIQEGYSSFEELVISYNVNTLVNEDHKYLDIYRPRFIKVSLKEVEDEFKKSF